MKRRTFFQTGLAAATAAPFAGMLGLPAMAQGTQRLRIAMTLSDIPTTTGMPSQGGEGMRFAGYPVFEPLVAWNLREDTDRRAETMPGLAESWEIDPEDNTRWIFNLRPDVAFHDGTPWNADAAIWNLERFWDEDSPQFEVAAAGTAQGRVSQMSSWEKIDDMTIALITTAPSSYFPQALTQLLFASPSKFEEKGGDWGQVGQDPAGTGPFRITNVVPRQSITMQKNPDYWDTARMAQVDEIVLTPIPDANTRLAALRSGQVDWIEVPPPDAIPGLEAAGFEISMKTYPHIWPHIFSFNEGSPFLDKRVRQAANYAIDREGLAYLMNGTVRPASGYVPPEDAWYGSPTQDYKYDPDRARELLAEAGYGPDNKVPMKVLTSSSGSGQLLPVQMNQLMQQNLNEVGFACEIEVLEWGQLINAFRAEKDSPAREGADAINMSLSFPGPAEWQRWFHGSNLPPVGSNWGYWQNEEFDALIDQVGVTFDPEEVDALLARAHEVLVEEAPWLFVVHDMNPRALAPNVEDFDPAQSWYQDFTGIRMG